MQPEPQPTPTDGADEPVHLTRRERRAAARGGVPAPKVAGPLGHRVPPPPAAKRNYAARKSG